jgi:hypothetical protein
VGDEAFFLVSPSAGEGQSIDTMTLRAGGVILTLTARADAEPDGGLDSLAEVAQVAVENLPPAG